MTGIVNPALFGMPDATTAGVPAGTTLTAYTGPMTITQAGTVIEGKIIDGTLTIDAANVTIKNCIIKNYGWWGVDGEGATNLSVLYCDFTASTSKDTNAAILGSGTFIGNDISQSENGIVLQGGASVVRDNFIHDLFDNFGEPHIDGISVQGGQNNVLIEHNTIESWDTSAIFIKNDFGPINNITVRNNLLYADEARGDPASMIYVYGPNTTNVSITNNYVEKGYWYYYATSNATPTISGNIEWNNKTDATPYPTSSPPPPSPTPSAPTIASFSNDSGVAGDGITNDNALQLKGTAAANSTVKIYDGSTQIGTVIASSTGSWDYITSVLTDAKHVLTATVTNSSGQTSAASGAVNVTVDTVAAIPVVTSTALVNSNQIKLSGSAEANSTVTVYDGTAVVGTGTANSSGAWSITTNALSIGTHTLTAKAADVAGNVSTASQSISSVIAAAPPAPAPGAPTIASYSSDSGVAGDGITNDKTLTLGGTAVANSTVNVFDGSTNIGTATANGSGAWTFTTATLAEGNHNFSATTTSSSGTSSASAALGVKIDSAAPNAPVNTGQSIVNGDKVSLTGTAEANSTVTVYEGTAVVGTVTANSTGAWNITTNALSTGTHTLTAKAADVAGNVSTASQSITSVIAGAPPAPAPTGQIESSGLTSLLQSGDKYYLNSNAGGTSLVLKSGGTPFAASSSPWAPIGVEQTATGYQIAWKLAGQDQYTIWNTDKSGNYISHEIGVVSGANSVLGAFEANLSQDLNGDGTVGSGTKTIESAGSTSLSQTGDNYQLTGSGGNLVLKSGGTPFAASSSPWAPIGVEQTATGYQIAWKLAGQDQYTIWNTDKSGNYISHAIGVVSGASSALGAFEANLRQDLNGDGSVGPIAKTIESAGSTDLSQAGDNYQLIGPGGNLVLKSGGTPFAASSSPWAPIGVEQTANGYQIAWKLAGQDQYTVWNTDKNGNYVSHAIGVVAGNSSTLKSFETSFQQDLNGDGAISGSTSNAPISSVGLTTVYKNWSDFVTIKGTADANSQIKLYDGNTSLGTVTTAADGTWSYKTASAVSDTVHTYTAQQIGGNGQVVGTSGSAILGSTGGNTLNSTSGNDILVGGGQADTFAFAANFGRDVIKDFVASGSTQDTIQFSKTVFDNFASVLSHASQVDQDVVISSGSDTLTLKNTKLGSLNSGDFHFA